MKLLRNSVDKKTLNLVYTAICQFILTYCITVWGGAASYLMISLERVQRYVLKVKMPPREGPVSKHDVRVRELATVFSEAKRGDWELSNENGEGQHDVPEDLEEDLEEEEVLEEILEEAVRVNDRVRLNYELYRYSKNAMLIVTTVYDEAHFWQLVTDLKRIFESFRFEVEVATVPDPAGLYAKCEQYFQKDFSDYGAAALVILTSMAVNAPPRPFFTHLPMLHPFPSFDDKLLFFEESRVVETFRLDRNPTLVDKPKIYITEANSGRRDPRGSSPDLIYLDKATYGDVIGFHVPLAFEPVFSHRPLERFCDKMSAAGDNNDVATIMEEISEDSKSIPWISGMFKLFPVKVVNNLRAKLFLARTENE